MGLPPSDKSQSAELFLYHGVVESHLGKRAALVVSTLFNYGRLNFKQISKKSNLPSNVVKKTLVSLIQMKCVSVWEDKSYKGNTTYYYFREDGPLLMLYSGEIISHMEKIYGNNDLTEIVQNFLSLGSLSVSDYLTSFGAQDAERTAKLEEHFTTLVKDKYLIAVQQTDHNPIKDLWVKMFKNALSKIPKTATTSELKRTAEAKSIAKLDLLNLLEFQPENLHLKDNTTMAKKVNPSISLTFSLQRFFKARRSQQLEHLCSHRVGKITSIIYKEVLSLSERDSPSVSDPLRSIGITNEEITREYEVKDGLLFSASQILHALPKSTDISGSIYSGNPKRRSSETDSSVQKRIKIDDETYGIPISNNIDLDEDEDDEAGDFGAMGNGNSLSAVDQHLRILTKSTIPFLRKAKDKYYVPFPELMVFLKRAVAESVITATLGVASTRILRCVRDNRLVSEKLINSVALLKEKEARSLTSVLVKHNFLQIQEVPKSADRAASKSVFLYRVNDKHSMDTLKTNFCWNMGRIHHKILLLKLENSGLIAKINRDDVKGKEMEYLLPNEILHLKKMNSEELILNVKLQRLLSLWEPFQFF